MVPLLTVASGFEARVVAARLGSEGITVTLRGAVDGPYPFGEVFVDVDAGQVDEARALLLADQVEAAFAGGAVTPRPEGTGRGPWPVAASVVVLAALAVLLASSVVRLGTVVPVDEDDGRRSAAVRR
jgi:hypothetical protein